MDTKVYAAKLQDKIVEENKKWEETKEQLQQQFASAFGAHQGRVETLKEQIAELSDPAEVPEEDDDGVSAIG